MTLLIVIVNYRTPDLTLDCLRSLQDEVRTVAGTRVIVTDNASGDDSVARLEAAVRANGWDDWATIQPLDRNGGFAAGNNAAIRPALAGDRSAAVRPAAEPGHGRPSRGAPGPGLVHGGPARRGHRGEPSGGRSTGRRSARHSASPRSWANWRGACGSAWRPGSWHAGSSPRMSPRSPGRSTGSPGRA